MDPTQTPPAGGTAPQVDLSNIEKMIGDLSSSVETKLGEFDQKMTDLSSENAELRKYIEGGGSTAVAPQSTDPTAPGWVPKSWDDFPALVEQKAKEIVEQSWQSAREQNEKMTKEQRDTQQRIDREIDNQLDTLTKDQILPPVTNPRDPNDPGNVARKELLALGVNLETPNLDAVARNVLVPAHQRGERFDPALNDWVKADPPLSGKYAPVGSSSSRTTSTPSGPDYKTIHSARNMDELIAYADQHGYGSVPPQV